MKGYALWNDGGTTRIVARTRKAVLAKASSLGAKSVRLHIPKKRADGMTWDETERWSIERGKWTELEKLRSKNPKTPRRKSVRARRSPRSTERRRAGTRGNPSLITYLANPSARVRLASDVQAVLYRHAKTREFYLHVFGNQGDGEIKREGRREYLRLDNLPSRTGVVLEAIGDGRALLVRHNEGKPLASEF